MNELGEIVQLPKIVDPRGNLTVAEQHKDVPFEVKRVYWTYDVPGGGHRGGHAHKEISEFIVALSGSFSVTLDNGREKKSFLLNHPWEGLLIGPGVWRTLEDFSSGAVCMVMASEYYDEADYIRNYKEYRKWIKGKKNTSAAGI
ncbi:MAG: FdtA/QdtA family cupin domain-containing protein [Prevotellaceae bacterium]|nr:FdtA/QdtA family cupin domain-containing protein [Prevotellaceae bacterium]